MESPPVRSTTLASILDTERVIEPARARVWLASLAQVGTVPPSPATPGGWTHQILVVVASNGVERATFRNQGGAVRAVADRAAQARRHIEALRAAAIAMLWGVARADAAADARLPPDATASYPRLNNLLIEQWDVTRVRCDSPDKFMTFFDATLALDRAAVPKLGREAFRTLSIQPQDAPGKSLKVGTLGKPFAAITETGKFQRGARPTPASSPFLGTRPRPPLTPSSPPLPPVPSQRVTARAFVASFAVHITIVIVVVIAALLLRR